MNVEWGYTAKEGALSAIDDAANRRAVESYPSLAIKAYRVAIELGYGDALPRTLAERNALRLSADRRAVEEGYDDFPTLARAWNRLVWRLEDQS